VFQATLRRELAARLGLVFDEMDRHGVAEVVGISAEMRKAFSRRRAEIVAEMERVGSHSGEGARMATLATRRAKPTGISEADLRAEWRQRAGDLRFDLSGVPRVPRTPELRADDDELAAELTHEHASFVRRDLIRACARAARQGAALDEIVGRTDAFLTSEHAVALAGERWTTPEILALEGRVVALATGPSRADIAIDPAAVAAAVDARPSISAEQTTMVEELCLRGRPVDVVIGRAGTGKTYTLDAVREAFEASGHRVLGVSLAARGARELQSGSGIASSTAHALHRAINSGRSRLRPGDLLVIDAAGMLGTRLMADLANEVGRAGGKMILVGDHKQLPPIEAGGLLPALASRVGVTELVENRRQRDPEERFITAVLREGRTELAVRRLDAHGHVTVAHNSDALRDQMVLDWWSHRENGADVVMGAIRRADVRDLNARAHACLEADGRLGPVVAVIDEQRFCVGDQVLAGRNRYDLGILNGDLGEITGADADSVHVRSCGREVHLPLDYVTDHLSHAYARTVHKTQGLTCDVGLLLGDDGLYAELGYTGLTRGRAENHLYTVVGTPGLDGEVDPLADIVKALDRSMAKAAAIAVGGEVSVG